MEPIFLEFGILLDCSHCNCARFGPILYQGEAFGRGGRFPFGFSSPLRHGSYDRDANGLGGRFRQSHSIFDRNYLDSVSHIPDAFRGLAD